MWFGAGEGWVLVSPDCLRTPASFARYAKRLFGSILQDTDLTTTARTGLQNGLALRTRASCVSTA
jgi:hypothetical protein